MKGEGEGKWGQGPFWVCVFGRGSEFVTSRLRGARSSPRLRVSGLGNRREEGVTLPGRRDERTQPLKTDCPLAARRKNAPPLLRLRVKGPKAIPKGFETTFQI